LAFVFTLGAVSGGFWGIVAWLVGGKSWLSYAAAAFVGAVTGFTMIWM
jgi:hypothetical protein